MLFRSQILGRKPKNREVARVMNIPEIRVSELHNFISREPISIDSLNTERFTEEDD